MDSMMKLLALSITAALVTACVPATVQEQRDDPIERRSFEIGQSYPTVYRAILHQARRCFHGGYAAERLYVGGDLYYDLKSGQVSVEVHTPTGIQVYLAAKVIALGETRTRVDVLIGLKLWEGLSAEVEGWVRQTSNRCVPK
jgi:hypothetical protein